MLNVAINGFGRIGRILERVNLKKNTFKLVAINDINSDIDNLAYLLKYDSIYGRLETDIKVTSKNILSINGQPVYVFNHKNIDEIPWYDLNIDIIIDSSGIKDNHERIALHQDKFKHYIGTCELGSNIKNIICGVNDAILDIEKDKYLASSTCDSAALSPIVKTILSHYEISHGFLTTLHPWLSYQRLLDSSKIPDMKDMDAFGLGRASLSSLIPKATSAVSSTNRVVPGILNKIEAFSYRIPTATVSSAILNFTVTTDISIEQLHEQFAAFAEAQNYKTMHLNNEHLVSIDYSGFDYSTVIDLRWTKVIDNRHVQLVYWYDNEWSYCGRLRDLIDCLTKQHMQRLKKSLLSNTNEALV